MENQSIEMLPAEVAQIAQNVSVEKRNEVQVVLNQVFNGVAKMREQLDTIVVEDENDKTNMKLANTIRLGVRQVRLDAEKTFDAKRGEVQQQMLSYKTEDSLWLKAKQTMQILTKEIEEQARWKEETKIRFEAEQKELATQQRMLKVAKVAPEVLRSEFENMSEETFVMFFGGLTKAYNDRLENEKKAEEELIEKEKATKLHNERKEQILPYWGFIPLEKRSEDFSTFTQNEWEERFDWCVSEKKKDDDAKEAQIIENLRLKAEAELKEKRVKERSKILQPFIVFIRDYNSLIQSEEDDFQKQFSEIKKGAELQWEQDRKDVIAKQAAEEKLKQEKEKLAAELQYKQDAEIAAEKERIDAENKAKAEAKKLAKSGDKAILSNWIDSFQVPNCLGLSSNSEKTYNEIYDKFESFKKWAKTEVEKI